LEEKNINAVSYFDIYFFKSIILFQFLKAYKAVKYHGKLHSQTKNFLKIMNILNEFHSLGRCTVPHRYLNLETNFHSFGNTSTTFIDSKLISLSDYSLLFTDLSGITTAETNRYL